MKVALDTNILAYASGIDDAKRQRAALNLLFRLPPHNVFLPVQVLGEYHNTLMRRTAFTRETIGDETGKWARRYSLIDTSAAILFAAMDLAVNHRMGLWDSVIMAATAEAGCRLLITENFQNGFIWNGVTVVNPFLEEKHPMLSKLLGD